MNDWNIQSRSQACQATEKPFEDNEPYHTLLFRTKEGYERLDVCEEVWRDQYGEGATDRKGFVSHWRGVFKVPPPKAPEPLERESAESLLRKIVELNDPQYADASYILAVMLERKRILKVQSDFQEDDRRIFVYERTGTGEVFTIADPELNLADMEKVQHDVALLMEHGLNPPTEETEDEAEDGAEGDGDGESAEGEAGEDAETTAEGDAEAGETTEASAETDEEEIATGENAEAPEAAAEASPETPNALGETAAP